MTAAAAPPGLAAAWVDAPAALAPLATEWHALAERTGADVYLRPDWQAVWWDHFGAGRGFAGLVLRQDGALAGVLPFCLDRLPGRLGPRVARLAGTDPHCIVFRLPLEEAVAAAALRLAVLHLTGPLRCAAVSFTPVSARAAHLPLLRALAAEAPLTLHEAPEGNHVVFDLPDDFAAWLARLSKKRRSQYQRDQRGLQAQFGMTAATEIPDAAAFAGFAALHDRQWQAVHRGGHFADWPGSAPFYADLAARTQGAGAAAPMRLFRLDGRDGPLAQQFALLGGGIAHWRLPARSLDPEAERLSIGKAGLLQMIAALIPMGIACIEAGRGDYDYKLAYGGTAVAVSRLVLRRRGPTAAAALRAVLAGADLLHLAYYRVWFLRLLPRLRQRLGLAPRPLWRLWIRSRL
jgi:CelD/BcsL family acetyltransferase involved in cellulose biosynthesis